MELYFEVLRKKTHIFCQAKSTSTVRDLKKIIEGILKVAPEKQVLKKQSNSKFSYWTQLEDNMTLRDAGFGDENASSMDSPAVIALVLPEDGGVVSIAALSTPPELPEQMRRVQKLGCYD